MVQKRFHGNKIFNMDPLITYQEELFNSLFHSKGYGIAMIDTKGNWIECNETTLSLFGYSKEELLKLTNLDVTHPDEIGITKQMFKDILTKKKDSYRYEKRYIRKNGSSFWVNIFVTPVCKESGEIIALSGIIADISKQRKIEEALKKSEQEYRTLFNGANDAIFIMNDKIFLECNQMTLDMFGCQKKEDIINHSPWEFSPPQQPDGRDSKEKAFHFINTAAKSLPQRFYWKHAKKDGTTFDAEVSLNRAVLGDDICLQAIVRDITERKKAEQDYQREKAFMDKLFESSPEAISVSDEQGKFNRVNSKFLDLFGFRENEVLGRKVDNVIAIGNSHDEAEKISRIVKSGKTIELETVRYRKDGTPIDVSVVATAINVGDLCIGGYGIYRDITKRKKGEKALRESEELYRNLVEKMPVGVYKSTHDGKFVEVNPAMIKMLGYDSKEELLDIDIKTELYFDASDRESIALAQQLEELDLFRLKKKDGSEIWVEDFGWFNVDEQGNILFHEGILRDVTERLQVEKKLLESEEKFRSLAEYSPNMIFINIKGRIVYANHLCEKIMGFTKEEFYSNDFNFINLIAPEYKVVVTESFRLHLSCEENPSFEVALITREGKKLYTMLSTKLIPFDGENAILGVITDITQRKQAEEVLFESEERLRSLFENISIGLYRTTAEGKILFANPALVHILGFNSFEELAERNLEQEGFEQDYPRFDFKQQIERNGFIKGSESKWKKKDGKIIYVRENAKAYFDNNGMINYYEGTIEDITDRKMTELQLAKQAIELTELIATKDKFFSIIAHDLKNPFNTILGFTDVLLTEFQELNNNEILKYLSFISTSSKQAYSLLENLLLWARTQTGIIAFQPELFDLQNSIRDVIELSKNQSTKKNISLTSNIRNHFYVIADKNMVNTILRNLLSNAIKFTPQNGKVIISANSLKDNIEISVRDTGVGITKEDMDNIFMIDRKTNTLGTEKETGSGLGLILCKEFVEKNSGTIWVESELGKGSTFKFTIPSSKKSIYTKLRLSITIQPVSVSCSK